MSSCGRCGTRIHDPRPEFCWFCDADLCGPCWEDLGHCGHEEAERINEASRMLDYEGRRALIITFLHGKN